MSFPFDLHNAAVSDSHLPCRAHAVPLPCRAAKDSECLSHLIYTVRPCLIHTCHAVPDHAVLLKATAQHVRRETACGLLARVRLLPSTTRSSTKLSSDAYQCQMQYINVRTFIYCTITRILCVCVCVYTHTHTHICMHKCKECLCHHHRINTVYYTMRSFTVHQTSCIHTFLKTTCRQPRRFSRGGRWIRWYVTRF